MGNGLDLVKRALDELSALAEVLAEHCICVNLDERCLRKQVSKANAELQNGQTSSGKVLLLSSHVYLLRKSSAKCALATSWRAMQETYLVPVESGEIKPMLAHHRDHADKIP